LSICYDIHDVEKGKRMRRLFVLSTSGRLGELSLVENPRVDGGRGGLFTRQIHDYLHITLKNTTILIVYPRGHI